MIYVWLYSVHCILYSVYIFPSHDLYSFHSIIMFNWYLYTAFYHKQNIEFREKGNKELEPACWVIFYPRSLLTYLLICFSSFWWIRLQQISDSLHVSPVSISSAGLSFSMLYLVCPCFSSLVGSIKYISWGFSGYLSTWPSQH